MEIWTAAIIVTLALAFGVEVIRRRVLDLTNIGYRHRAKN